MSQEIEVVNGDDLRGAVAGISNGLWLCTTSASPANHSTGGHSKPVPRPDERPHRNLDVDDPRGRHLGRQGRRRPIFPGAREEA